MWAAAAVAVVGAYAGAKAAGAQAKVQPLDPSPFNAPPRKKPAKDEAAAARRSAFFGACLMAAFIVTAGYGLLQLVGIV